jgi:chemotaxis protein methyltransferase CheR
MTNSTMTIEMLGSGIQPLRELIYRKSGIVLEGDLPNALQSVVRAKMESRGIVSPGEYYRFLGSSFDGQRELEELISHITVNETYFFRNAAHFAALRERILAKSVEDNGDDVVRIWSAGCSTGEEPYSIAMVALDFMQDQGNLKIEILGTDVDKGAIDKAERGLYGKRSLRAIEDRYRKRYFSKANGKFEIDSDLKGMVRFGHFNLMEKPYPKPSKGNWDIIFCRNVIIYFDHEAVSHVTDGFHSVLAENGYLFMGHSEALDSVSSGFAPVEVCGAFVYVKKPYGDRGKVNLAGSVPLPRASLIQAQPEAFTRQKRNRTTKHRGQRRSDKARELKLPKQEEGAESIYDRAYELFVAGRSDEALRMVETQIESKSEDAWVHLLAGKIYADRGLYEQAIERLKQSIQLEPLLTEAHYLLGVVCQRSEQISKAIDEFKRAIYIDRDCALSHFGLACVYHSKGLMDDAAREYANTVKILERFQDDEIVEFSGGITVRILTQTCLKRMEELGSVISDQ